MSRLSRRSLFAGLGAASVLAPFVPLGIRSADAHATPRRLILVFTPNGTVYDRWQPTGSGTEFGLSTILAPLEAHKEKLIVVDGLGHIDGGPGDAHQKGIARLWSGTNMLEGGTFPTGEGGTVGWGGGITVDQMVANEIGHETVFPSLEFGVQTENYLGGRVESRMSYAGPNQPVQPEDSPFAAFDRIFSDFDVDSTELAKLREKRQSVIDLVSEDLDRLSARYDTDGRQKLEAHLDGIREIERRLELEPNACAIPEEPEPFDWTAGVNYPTVGRAQMDLLVAAMACDLTRVGSILWSGAVSNTRFTWLGIQEGHHSISHYPAEHEPAREALTSINIWYAEQLAYLIDKLANTPEGEGTMLDNTMIVWGNELASGPQHSLYPLPFVIAGGAGGYLKTGQYLKLPEAREHNRLLVSICHAMGLTDVQTYGDNDIHDTGPLDGLT